MLKITELSQLLAKIFQRGELQPQASLITLRAVALLFIGVGILAIINVALLFGPIGRGLVFDYFHLGSDNNISAWYSSMMLALAAFLALECNKIAQKFGRRDQLVFLIFGLLLMLMSCDEIVRFHEVLPEKLANHLEMKSINVFDSHPWVLLGGPAVVAVLVSMVVMLNGVLKRNRTSQVLMQLGFAAIILGGIVLEAAIDFFPKGVVWKLELLLEENLEMSGTLLICSSLIIWRDHVISKNPEITPLITD